MRHEIPYRPTFAQLTVHLDRGEAIQAEAGAMLGHSRGVDVETGMGGGFVQSLKRSVFGGESFFLNRFVAREPGSVTFAPRLPGDVIERDLGTEPLFVQSSSFLASTPDVDLDTKFGGFKTFFAGEGLFLLRLTGPGRAFLSSFGAIDEVRLGPGERYVVDTGHVVAFEASNEYSVRRVGGLTSTVLSGEGLVVEFEGPGSVWTQSRSPDAFLSWIAANVPSGGAVVPVDYDSGSTPGDAGVVAPPGGNPPNAGPSSGRGGRFSNGGERSPKRGGRQSGGGKPPRWGRGRSGGGPRKGGNRGSSQSSRPSRTSRSSRPTRTTRSSGPSRSAGGSSTGGSNTGKRR